MVNRSKSSLFLIEQLIAVAVFAICAVACIKIISTAYFYSRDSRDTGFAIIAAENAAESFKAASGDLDLLDLLVYYDKNWTLTDEQNAAYMLSIHSDSVRGYSTYNLVEGKVSVKRISGDELISLNVAAISRAYKSRG